MQNKPADKRPIADILVRVPADPNTFAQSRYMVVRAGEYNPDPTASSCGENDSQPPTLAVQLQELSALDTAVYENPAVRVPDWISENTGDIVPLANMAHKFFFDTKALHATHGSLMSADALIPLAVAYPWATGDASEDTTLAEVLALLGAAGGRIEVPMEAKTLERFFGIQ